MFVFMRVDNWVMLKYNGGEHYKTHCNNSKRATVTMIICDTHHTVVSYYICCIQFFIVPVPISVIDINHVLFAYLINACWPNLGIRQLVQCTVAMNRKVIKIIGL